MMLVVLDAVALQASGELMDAAPLLSLLVTLEPPVMDALGCMQSVDVVSAELGLWTPCL
jgi:hypothetical protein